jgi:dihydroneopterin aldolase
VTDRIVIRGLRVRGFHGVHDFERAQGQDFVADVCIEVPLATAAGSDSLAQTVDYSALVERLAGDIRGEPVNLIETLAERLAASCLANPAVVAVDITVHKPQAPVGEQVDDIAVTLRRERP